MQINKLVFPVVSAAILSWLPLSGILADETYTRTTVIQSPGTVVSTPDAVVTPSGSVVYLRTTSPLLLVTTIEERRKLLQTQIQTAVERGDISSEQGSAMNRELKRIGLETSSNTVSYPAAVMLAQDLDLIGTQYRTVVTTAPAFVPIIEGSHFTIYNGQVVQLDDLSIRRAGLEARVTKDYLKGKLTDSQAATLRAKLSNIGTEAAIYKADGNLDFKEARRLYTDFDRVASQIDSMAGKENN
jgi:hypothetical protein